MPSLVLDVTPITFGAGLAIAAPATTIALLFAKEPVVAAPTGKVSVAALAPTTLWIEAPSGSCSAVLETTSSFGLVSPDWTV